MLRVTITLNREDTDDLYRELIAIGAEDIEIEEFTPEPSNMVGRLKKERK